MTRPEPTQPPATGVPAADDHELQRALEQLTRERQRRLTALIDETRRHDQLAKALPADAAQALEPQREQLNSAILELLMGWQALGGTVALVPPPPTGAPQATAPQPALRAEAPSASTSPAPPRHTADPQRAAAPDPRPQDFRPPDRPHHRAEAPEPPEDWAQDLAALLEDVACTINSQEEMESIQRAASASFGRWAHYPRSVQRALVGNLACRLRHLQDHLGVTGSALDSAFRSLTRFSKSFQPGWVNGLTRGRGPAAESWAEEGRVWWDQLALSAERPDHGRPPRVEGAEPVGHEQALAQIRSWLEEWREAPDVAKPMCLEKTLGAIQAALDAGLPHTDTALCNLADEIYDHLELARFRRLRQGIRDLELAEREDRGIEQPEALPSDWPWWSHTVGRRALLLGAALDDQRVELVERSFGLAELRCQELEAASATEEQLRSLLGSGGIDLVLLVGEHSDQDHLRAAIRSCQVRGLPWVHVTRTPGVTRVRMAIERFLQPDPRAEGGAH